MTDDPWAQFIVPDSTPAPPAPAAPANAPGSGQPAASSASADPWAAFVQPADAGSQPTLSVGFAPPPDVRNVPTAKDDPVYHGAVPIQAAPDQGGLTAFASGVQGVPVIGPALSAGVQDAAALARSYANGTTYNAEKQQLGDMVDASRQQHPVAAFAGDMTGATAALAPVVAAAPAAFGAGPGGLTAGKIGMGALSGAGIGGADAAVRSDGDALAALQGSFTGAAFGAAAPVAGAVLSRAGQMAGQYLGRALAPNTGVSQPVAEIIGRSADATGMGGGPGAARIAAGGPDAMMIDGLPGLNRALDTAIQRNAPGSLAARQAIDARAAGANQDLTGALDQAFGPPQGIQTATNDIRNGTAAARQAAYDAAYAAPIDYSTDAGRALEGLVRDRVPPGIIARANHQMRVDGIEPSQQVMARVMPDGTVTYEQMPGVQQVDYITRSLNDVSRMGDGQGALGGNTNEGRAYGGLARQLRDALRQAVPEYGTALDTAAQPIQARNALEFGSTMLRPNVPRDVVAATVADMTPPELTQARQGVRSQLAETLANVHRTLRDQNGEARQAMAAVKALSSDAAQEKIGLLISPQERQNMAMALNRATRALDLRAAMADGSGTAGRSMANEVIQRAAEPNTIQKALTSGGPMKATRSVLEHILGIRPQEIARREDAIHGELAGVLTAQRGPAAASMLDRIIAAHGRRTAINSFAEGIPFGALTQTGSLALLPSLNRRTQ